MGDGGWGTLKGGQGWVKELWWSLRSKGRAGEVARASEVGWQAQGERREDS